MATIATVITFTVLVIVLVVLVFAIALCKCAKRTDEKIEELLNEQ